MLPCGHACVGVREETRCPPCPTCLDCMQSPDEICNICYTEELGAAPAVMLDCGHLFHYECVRKRISEGWPTPQITFGFLECPLCNMRITAPILDKSMQPMRKLYRELEHMAHKQLTEDINMFKEDLKDEMSEFYENPVGLALRKLAYYECFKCKVPYYGGMVRCADMIGDVSAPNFVCNACSGIGKSVCPVHGDEYIIWKCRFCCEISHFFC